MADSFFEDARESFQRRNWAEARERFSAADRTNPLEAEDLERLAIASHMVGRDDESSESWSRSHQEFLRRGDVMGAARSGFWQGFLLLLRGEQARGSGWLARVQRMLDEAGEDCVERGYLVVPPAVMALHRGDRETSRAGFDKGMEFAARFRNRPLEVMCLMGLGQIAILEGHRDRGLAMLDEVMVAATEGELPPILIGLAYCVSIDCCQLAFDLERAQEWTNALGHWCEMQPGLVPYRRECLVHQSELLQLHGAWSSALDEARKVNDLLQGADEPQGVGAAYYQEAELYRLQGEFRKAEEAYRLGARWGRNPQPGLALLRLAGGDNAAATAAIRLALDETNAAVERARLLPPFVEIMLAAGEVDAAEEAAAELASTAAAVGAPLLEAASARATGAVLLARGDARAALAELRRSWTAWQSLDAPYEGARTRVLIGRACRELGDGDSASLEFDSARWTFQNLGAAPNIALLDAVERRKLPGKVEGLTARELEVLRLVAAGKSNQAIAGDLVVSQNTVRRHLQNIFSKLGVSSRAAATAFAFQNDLA